MLKSLLEEMPVAPFDTTNLPVAQKTVLNQLEGSLHESVNVGIPPETMVRFTAFLCVIMARSGLAPDLLASPECQHAIVRRAFLSDFSVTDDHVNQTINELRDHCGLPAL